MSESLSNSDLIAPAMATPSSDSSFSANAQRGMDGKSPESSVEKTVISQQPVAGPEDFFRSAPIVEMARLLIGKQLDHFVLDELVGGGGMGAVFRGRDLRLDRVVAIKVIPSARRDAETLRRFRVEAQSAAKLDHPNIARVYYVGETEQWNYIVFEYIEGINLRDMVLQRGALSVDDSVYYIRQIAESLEHARTRDVVHRDIKPSNILITRHGQAKLVDMGLARSNELEKSSQDVTASGVTLGTFDYISPEQAKDPRIADVRSDLYSLGCTWYYLLVARPPFPEGTALQKLLKHGSEKADDPSLFRDDLSNDLIAILYKLIAKRPSDRYQTPLDLIADLQTLAKLEGLQRNLKAGSMVVAPIEVGRTTAERMAPWAITWIVFILTVIWLQSREFWNSHYELGRPRSDSNAHSQPSSPSLGKSAPQNPLPFDPGVPSPQGIINSIGPNPPRTEFPRIESPKADLRGSEVDLRVESSKGNEPSKSSEPSPSGIEANRLGVEDSSKTPPSLDRVGLPNGTDQQATIENASHKELIVVRTSQSSPVIEEGKLVVGTLEEAIRIAEMESRIKEILLSSTKVVTRNIKIARSGITIRGAIGFHPKLEWNSEVDAGERYTDARIPWFDIGNNDLTLEDLRLDVVLSGSRVPRAIFRLEPSSGLTMKNCAVTVQNSASAIDVAMIYGDSLGRRSLDPIEAFAIPSAVAYDPVQIRLENTIFRGESKWLVMPEAFRTEIRWSNGWIAINDRWIDVGGTNLALKTPVTIRLEMDRVTLACRYSLARLTLSENHRSSVCISRDARDCAFYLPRSDTLVEVQGLESTEDVLEAIDLRGEDNAYDSGIEDVLSIVTRNGNSERFQFDNAPMDSFRERSMESSIRWSGTIPSSLPFHLQRPIDYRQRPGNFHPGFQLDLLPEL